ncbi:hypothetical protein F3Y22_tig00110895pilonHSYRG00287 [Hibiscus syriacus]|uniref:RRM domain-containing protein n=1 Tax=Hibiscus syriacus TaxID=106335 RepID=A0A6A2ZFR8_HIBSY|nr:hypothetical protein F3Y22_tig00110895pilonHSYRG00287 [Hibiscus syriacus]
MKKSTVPTRKSNAIPSLGTPNHHHQLSFGMQKGWSSERVALHNNGERRQANVAGVLPLNNGKTLPSKWEDAERWIFSPVSGDACVRKSNLHPQRRPKSKSGPLGSPGIAYHSLYSPPTHKPARGFDIQRSSLNRASIEFEFRALIDSDYSIPPTEKEERPGVAMYIQMSQYPSSAISKKGNVLRVYIPSNSNKPNYRNYTFAFVQFAKEDGLKKAIANVNGIWIDGKKISVGVAKYQKQRFKQAVSSNGRRDEDKWKKDVNRSRRGGPESYSRLRDERSYKVVLTSYDGRREGPATKEIWEGHQNKDVGLRNLWEMHIPSDEYDWVKRSLTGIIKSQFDLELAVKGLASEGIKVKGAKWGYSWNSCIISFGSQEGFEEVWASRREEVSFWFDWLDPLMSVDGVPMAFCSVELVGIPLLCWNVPFLEKLVSRWGKLVCFHESTVRREDLAVARALLRVASPFDIQETVILGSYGRSYKVKISVGSVSTKQENSYVENFTVAGEGEFGDEVSSVEKEDRSSGRVGSPQLLAEDSRDTVDRWLVGEVCKTVAGGSGKDYRGLGLRNVFINECDKAHQEDLSEPNSNINRISPSGPAVNLLNLSYGNRLESRVEMEGVQQQPGSEESKRQNLASVSSDLNSITLPGGAIDRGAVATEVEKEARKVHMGSYQGLGLNKKSLAKDFRSWCPSDHLSRSLYFRNASIGRWKKGSTSKVYRRSKDRKVWFNPSSEGVLQSLELPENNRTKIGPLLSNQYFPTILEGSPMGVEEEGSFSLLSAGDHFQSPRCITDVTSVGQSDPVTRNEDRRKRRLLVREA